MNPNSLVTVRTKVQVWPAGTVIGTPLVTGPIPWLMTPVPFWNSGVIVKVPSGETVELFPLNELIDGRDLSGGGTPNENTFPSGFCTDVGGPKKGVAMVPAAVRVPGNITGMKMD